LALGLATDAALPQSGPPKPLAVSGRT